MGSFFCALYYRRCGYLTRTYVRMRLLSYYFIFQRNVPKTYPAVSNPILQSLDLRNTKHLKVKIMLKKTLFFLLVAVAGYSKLFAQNGNPAIHVPDLNCSLTICLDAMDICRQVSCSGGQCVTVPAHSPGIYYANPGSSCLTGAGRNCAAWQIRFTDGPCEGIANDAPDHFVVQAGTATGWTLTASGQNLSFMWDGSSFFIQN